MTDFQDALEAFTRHLLGSGLVENVGPVGQRCTDTILDTDEERDHAHFLLMTFRDRAQADRAVAHIENRIRPGVEKHDSMYRHISDPVFICWEDVPPSR